MNQRLLSPRAVACLLLAGVGASCRSAATAPPPPPPPSATAIPAAEATAEGPHAAQAAAREEVELAVRTGFLSREELVQLWLDVLEEEDGDLSRAQEGAQRGVDVLLEQRRKAATGWPKVTDCDRLDAAFASLELAGILARQHFGDCQTCALADMEEEMDDAREARTKVLGYTFFHQQDTERAVEGGPLLLSFGDAGRNNDAASVAVGRQVVAVLERHELKVAWDGKAASRIGVLLDWKRRPPAR